MYIWHLLENKNSKNKAIPHDCKDKISDKRISEKYVI
jgi:hypothetical protein